MFLVFLWLMSGLPLFTVAGVIYAFIVCGPVFIAGLVLIFSLIGLQLVYARWKVRSPIFYLLTGFFMGLVIFSILGIQQIAWLFGWVL